MKRISLLFLFLICIYGAYYDLTYGTLPSSAEESATNEEQTTEMELPKEPYQEVIVEPGYTVLSIVEHLHDGPVPATIAEITHDFSVLNNGLAPELIRVNETYRFPIY